MKLTVENFGPIRKADVVIGPMTVFVGPSNTGKSYLAILVYAVLETLNSEQFLPDKSLSSGGLLKLVRTALEFPEKQEKHLLAGIEKLFSLWAKNVSEAWKSRIAYCLGEDGKKMLGAENLVVKISSQQTGVVLDVCSPANSEIQDKSKQYLVMMAKQPKNDSQERSGLALLYALFRSDDDEISPEDIESDFAVFEIIWKIYSFFSTLLCASLLSAEKESPAKLRIQPHYLPASRGGIMQSHRALVESVLQRAPVSGLSGVASGPAFTGIVSDFVRKLVTLPNAQTRSDSDVAKAKWKVANIGKAMEKEIMAGEIKVERSETSYPDFRYQFSRSGGTYELPLTNASSMVSELAPLSIFMRYYVAPGDLFIIEEPEAHLHPGAQRDITNILVQLVNAGVRVLITTHSDTVLEQLGNYVQAAEIGKNVQKQSLAKDKLSTYLFAQPKSGKQKTTKVKKVRFNPETGLLTKDHLDVSSALYNEVVSLLDGGES